MIIIKVAIEERKSHHQRIKMKKNNKVLAHCFDIPLFQLTYNLTRNFVYLISLLQNRISTHFCLR
jgi:hypothetical protein